MRRFATRPARESILLVGEGDFSFALALARLRGESLELTATSLDSEEEVLRRYGGVGVARTLDELARAGVRVLHGVDATRLHEYLAASATAAAAAAAAAPAGGGEGGCRRGHDDDGASRPAVAAPPPPPPAAGSAPLAGGAPPPPPPVLPHRFDCVQFQFPHPGGTKIHLCRELLRGFCASASQVLSLPPAATAAPARVLAQPLSQLLSPTAGAAAAAEAAEAMEVAMAKVAIEEDTVASSAAADPADDTTAGACDTWPISWMGCEHMRRCSSDDRAAAQARAAAAHPEKGAAAAAAAAVQRRPPAAQLLATGLPPRIVVTLARGQGGTAADAPHLRAWGDSWQLTEQAAGAGLLLAAVSPFDEDLWAAAGYNSRGYKRSEHKGFAVSSARSHVLVPTGLGVEGMWSRTHTFDCSFWCDQPPMAAAVAVAAAAAAAAETRDELGTAAEATGEQQQQQLPPPPPVFTEERLLAAVTAVAALDGAHVAECRLLDEFEHPVHRRRSKCYRMAYTAQGDAALSTEGAAELHTRVKNALPLNVQVEVRC